MKSNATTVKDFLASLPPDRRAGIEAVRAVILKNLDKDYEETMAWGVISYSIPQRMYPAGGGHKYDPARPLMVAGLGNNKNYMSVYLMHVYAEPKTRDWFQKAWVNAGKKLHMGGCCIHFKTLEDAALDVIAEAVALVPAKQYFSNHLKALVKRKSQGSEVKKLSSAKKTAKKPPAQKVAKKSAVKKVAKKSAK